MKSNTESEIDKTLSFLDNGFTGNLDGFKESILNNIECEKRDIPVRHRRNVVLTAITSLLFLVNIYSARQMFTSKDTASSSTQNISSYLSSYEEQDVTFSINKNLTGTLNEK